MVRKYKCLSKQVYVSEDYSLVPIRHKDRYDIMQWRNEQLYHLRQSEPLTKEKQDAYFENVIAKFFDKEQPDQILFSFLKGEECIGYGGLVHINWRDRHAEISFVMDTKLESEYFNELWTLYLYLIEQIAFIDIDFHKIFTYAFDLRPYLYPVLKENGFIEEARLKDHVLFEDKYSDVLIHSKIKNGLNLRIANKEDVDVTYQWVNNSDIRKYSFTKTSVSYEEHSNWFFNKISQNNCLYYIAEIGRTPVGSFRVDKEEDETIISFLLDSMHHGKGFGKELLKMGINKTKTIWSGIKLIGFVLPENRPSAMIFDQLNFNREVMPNGTLKFTLNI